MHNTVIEPPVASCIGRLGAEMKSSLHTTTRMKTTLKILSLALIALVALASCKTTKEDTHSMGHKSNTWPMKDKDMPGYR